MIKFLVTLKEKMEGKNPGLINFDTHTVNNTMINATQMAKSFNKQPANWLRLKSTKIFLSGLATVKGTTIENLVLKIKKSNDGGSAEGIWIHEEAALEFARWLSPSFAIWNNQHTKQLLQFGKTENNCIVETLPALVSNLLHLNKQFDEGVSEQSRKILYHDAVLQSRTLIPVTVIAKELNMSAVALNKKLQEKKIIYKSDNHWLLYAGYQNKGYTGTKTALYIDSQGKYQSSIHTYWTEKGREFIHALLHEAKQIA